MTRILPPAEWPRLRGTLLESVWPRLDPASAFIRVVEDGDRIVGHAVLFAAWHLEAAWMAPGYARRIGVGRRLLTGVRADLKARGIREVVMMARSAVGRRLCQKLGKAVHMTCDHFAVSVGDR